MDTAWYNKKTPDVFSAFGSSENGLTQEEVVKRVKKYGLNKLPEAKPDSLLIIFLRQFQSPLIYILLLASSVVLLMKEFIDGIIILFVLLFNAIVGTIQEGKAQNTLLALKKFAETNTRVIRDGKELVIPDYEVVPGDIVILQEGDKVPADARIIESNNLKIDEAALTGESLPIHKYEDAISAPNLQTSDQRNMVFKGTHVLVGNGKALVVAIGIDTVLGKISKEIAVIHSEAPLKANIRYLTRLIITVTIIVCTSVFIFGVFTGHSVREMFTTVVSLAVSIIPEGLPIVMTLVLATGVWRMSKRNALVKKLQAVEALGQARVIAVDKTGTLTKNEILLQEIYVGGKTFRVEGEGYSPEGSVFFNESKIDPLSHSDLLMAGKHAAFVTNNGIVLDEDLKTWRATGDPTESAISVFAQKVGFHRDTLEKESPRHSELPFDYKKKYHVVSHKIDDQLNMTVLGAPEEILEMTDKIWHEGKSQQLTQEKKKELEEVLVNMSQEGLRVLALAVKHNIKKELKHEDVKELTFVGFLGLKDALRPEVNAAMEKAVLAGIKVVMITGDHKITAEAIAREAGIFHEGDTTLTGDDLDSLSENELADMLGQVSVFARVTPAHKLKIVQAYKKMGQVIAMTGDGVNDAPSLVAADLGVSMGKIGTEVAKEASDIVLLDDNFASIIAAVEEGRSIYKTIKKVILYLFAGSLSQVLTIIGALLLGFPLPLLAAQIIWLNFVTDGFLDVSLAMEPKEKGLLNGNFKRPKKYLIDSLMIWRMFFMAVPLSLGALYLFNGYYEDNLTKAWTMVLTTLAMGHWFNAWNCRSESRSIFQLNPIGNRFLAGATLVIVIMQIFAVYNPFMQKVLHTTSLGVQDWILIVQIASTIILAEEIRKFFYRSVRANSSFHLL